MTDQRVARTGVGMEKFPLVHPRVETGGGGSIKGKNITAKYVLILLLSVLILKTELIQN